MHQAFNSWTQVKNCIFQFKDLLDKVLNGTFHMLLPSTFEKVMASNIEKKDNNNTGRGKGGNDKKKKRKNKSKNSNFVKNPFQPDEFKVTNGKSWKGNFAKQLPHD